MTTHAVLRIQADYQKSVELASRVGLRLPRADEALKLLVDDESLKNQIKGSWFYVEGKGLKESGLYGINKHGGLERNIHETNEHGYFVIRRGMSMENIVNACPGPHELAIAVHSDDISGPAAHCGRFALRGNYKPDGIATVVIGIPYERKLLRK